MQLLAHGATTMGFTFLPISNNRLAAPSLAMALLMASTGSLPTLAANRVSGEANNSESGAPAWQRIANQNAEEKKKKKKKNQPNEKHNSGHGSKQNQNINQKERERIYQEGLEKGKKKGYEKGTTKGYGEGFQYGK